VKWAALKIALAYTTHSAVKLNGSCSLNVKDLFFSGSHDSEWDFSVAQKLRLRFEAENVR
jgi:hypothetical protein